LPKTSFLRDYNENFHCQAASSEPNYITYMQVETFKKINISK
jgi:hypothetical protein